MLDNIKVHIRKPVWKDRSISINKSLVSTALYQNRNLEITIGANPYNKFKYIISPRTILDDGKIWKIKGCTLFNFPIKIMLRIG